MKNFLGNTNLNIITEINTILYEWQDSEVNIEASGFGGTYSIITISLNKKGKKDKLIIRLGVCNFYKGKLDSWGNCNLNLSVKKTDNIYGDFYVLKDNSKGYYIESKTIRFLKHEETNINKEIYQKEKYRINKNEEFILNKNELLNEFNEAKMRIVLGVVYDEKRKDLIKIEINKRNKYLCIICYKPVFLSYNLLEEINISESLKLYYKDKIFSLEDYDKNNYIECLDIEFYEKDIDIFGSEFLKDGYN